ncbi:hypothetical protein IMSHALPRED_006835 [Imshaugia aleurites]|uniref:Uncharacterized protein n=1 Tax=Imshaugia aleurites TaxID=172621 RepID=A0A8H3ISL1_9LECA|nr:hypothetical protein IMSHALPRED_006835 [Imshaugia aleurites]
MRRYSAGKQWEDHNRKRQEAENEEREAQKAAAAQALRAQIEGLPSLSSVGPFPFGRPRHVQDSTSRFYRRQEDTLELDAQGTPPPQYQQHQTPLTPPASDGEAPELDSGEQVIFLQKAVVEKEAEIKRLESDIDVEKHKRRQLQAERHDAVDAQRRAGDEVFRLKRKVANLDQLLDASITREKELENELDICREEIRALKRELHEERCKYECEVRAQEVRDRQRGQRFGDTESRLENEIGGPGHLNQNVGAVVESEVQK